MLFLVTCYKLLLKELGKMTKTKANKSTVPKRRLSQPLL